jgi:SAM-dependent methyltransferase
MQRDQPQSTPSLAALKSFGSACRARAANFVAHLLYHKPACYTLCIELVRDQQGIEIGGPSQIFSSTGQLPLYESVGGLDNCNFTENTLWGRNTPHHGTYRYAAGKPAGRQHILEAVDLREIPSASYDFLLSSHTLEHIANPIKALGEWKRIVKPCGTLILVIPHKDGTFDHQRPVTAFEHLLQDYRRDTAEDDLSHLDEIMQLHDFSRDKGAPSKAYFHQRALKNPHNRGLHHHVFDTALAVLLADHVGLELLQAVPARPMHIVLVCRAPAQQPADNSHFMQHLDRTLASSPFSSDRHKPSQA